MASSGGPAASGPTVERIVSEGALAAAKIIMEARFPTTRTRAGEQQQRPWFNIEVQEVEGAAKALERWRREGPSLPLVLEVFLQPWGAQAAGKDRVETLLERWVVHYYPMLPEGPSHLSRSQLSRLNPSSVYKRLVITLRSLYTYLRVLPAYRMYRACKRQRGASFSLGYRLHSTLPGSSAAAAPGTRRMQSFKFGPVDTPYGQLRMSVDYQPASTVTILEQTTSPPPLPQIISDYVGGGAADGAGSSGRGVGPGSAAGAGSRQPLRHAMSASVVSPTPGPSSLQPPSPPQRHALGGAQQQTGSGSGGSPQSAGSLGRTAGGWPIRRSWSTSMRGVSPQRQLSQPPSEMASPTTAAPQETPYGSAPQAVSLPAMLRTLSSSAGRYLVGSPSGRPPLAKPPRTASSAAASGAGSAPASRPLAGALGSSPASGGSGGGGLLSAGVAAAASTGAAAEEEGDEEMAGSPCGSVGSGPRQSSAPMSIPGRGGFGSCGTAGRGRRLRSSNDLWALQNAAAMHKPLSAPAVSHMQQPAAAQGRGSDAPGAAQQGALGAAGGTLGPQASPLTRDHPEPSASPPPTRLPIIPGTLDSESSGSAASSLYPTSCSPQLPFAFTPSAQSLASFGGRPGGGALQEPGPMGRLALERASPRLGLARRSPGAPGAGGLSVPQQGAMQQLRTLAAAGGASSSAGSGAGAASMGAATPSSAGYSPSSGGSSGAGAGGGGVTGREVPARTALMRRTSWSSRSSAFGPLAGEASQPGVGYSVSPMQDPALESLLGGSTPRQFSLAAHGGLPSPLAAAGGAAAPQQGGGGPTGRPGGGGALLGYGSGAPPLLTFPSPSPEMSGGMDEADVLPFALDEGSASPFKPRSPAQPSQQQQQQRGSLGAGHLPVSTGANAASPAAATAPAAPASRAQPGVGADVAGADGAPPGYGADGAAAIAPAVVDTDAAVGAFVRLIQEAPPLRLHAAHAVARGPGRAASADLAGLQAAAAMPLPGTSSGSDSSAATCLSDGRGLTLQAGLRQFSALRERLQQRGVMVGPCPAEA